MRWQAAKAVAALSVLASSATLAACGAQSTSKTQSGEAHADEQNDTAVVKVAQAFLDARKQGDHLAMCKLAVTDFRVRMFTSSPGRKQCKLDDEQGEPQVEAPDATAKPLSWKYDNATLARISAGLSYMFVVADNKIQAISDNQPTYIDQATGDPDTTIATLANDTRSDVAVVGRFFRSIRAKNYQAACALIDPSAVYDFVSHLPAYSSDGTNPEADQTDSIQVINEIAKGGPCPELMGRIAGWFKRSLLVQSPVVLKGAQQQKVSVRRVRVEIPDNRQGFPTEDMLLQKTPGGWRVLGMVEQTKTS